MKRLSFSIFLLLSCLIASAQEDTISTMSLDNIVVTGTRTKTTARNIPVTVSVIDRQKLTEGQRINILPTLAEQVPGLFVTQRGVMGFGVSGGAAGGISVRGLSAGTGQVLVLIDGHPQYQGVFGHSISDSYQTMMAERVEVVRGPASVLYGSNAMGGVINIVTRGMKNDGVRTNINIGAGSYGTVQTEISNQLKTGRFSSTIAAQYSRSDNHRPNMGFEQYGGYIKLAYDISNHWNAFADADITHFNASYPGTAQKPMLEADQWITRGVATIGIENNYRNTSGRLSIYDNFGWHKINDGYAVGGTPQKELFRSRDALIGVSWYQTVNNLFKGNSITIGVDYQHIYGRAYYTSRETGEVVATGKRAMQSGHTHNNEIAGYVDFRQDLTPWLTLDAGIRIDNHSVAGTEWIPQFGAVVRPNSISEFKATVSKGFRNPTMKDMYLYAVANHDSLRAERLWSYEIAWKQHLLNGALTYGINLFIENGDNIIQAVAGRNINTGKISNRGAEIEASWRIDNHWSLNTNHSFLNMKYHVVGTPEYKGYLGANGHYGKWNFGIGIQQLSGLFTEVGDNEHKENATLLNAFIDYTACKTLKLWLRGDNLLAQKYEINAGYPMPRATFMAGVNVSF